MQERNRILVYTLHRSGSMLLHQVCRELCRLAKLCYYSPNHADVTVGLRHMAAPGFWHRKAGCFGPLRMPIPVPGIESARVILHLRDPRDVLTSMFYAYCYSHEGPLPPNTGVREQAAGGGIDRFVLKTAFGSVPPPGDHGTGADDWDLGGNLLERYRTYLDRFIGNPNVTLLRYEDMVDDFEGWVGALVRPFGLEGTKRVQTLAGLRPVRPPVEDSGAHARQVAPGDAQRKLRPETLERLDRAFGPILRTLGYPAEKQARRV